MEIELIKAIPQGGPMVIFVVIVLILTRQNQTAVANFQAQIQATVANFQEQIQALNDTMFKIQAESTRATNDLATAVRELQHKVDFHTKG